MLCIAWERYKDMMNLKNEEMAYITDINESIVSMKTTLHQQKIIDLDVLACPLGFKTWEKCNSLFKEKTNLYTQYWKNQNENFLVYNTLIEKNTLEIEKLEQKLVQWKETNKRLKEARDSLGTALELENERAKPFKNLVQELEGYYPKEKVLNDKLFELLKAKTFVGLDVEDMKIVLWKMNLERYLDMFQEVEMDGKTLAIIEEGNLIELGVARRDVPVFLYHIKMMCNPGYEYRDLVDCIVCEHDNPRSTKCLLEEWEVPIDQEMILQQGWISPYLIYLTAIKEEFRMESAKDRHSAATKLRKLRSYHEQHLIDMQNYKPN